VARVLRRSRSRAADAGAADGERTLGEMVQSINAELPKLEAGLHQIRVPVGFVHGSRSPMPIEASTDAAERIPGAWVDVVQGAGHFIWVEAPGAVRVSLRRLTAE
jgi:pimeloyl-ACP methyl ester carboxylesterase